MITGCGVLLPQKVMARPGYNQLGTFQTLTYTSQEYSADRSAADDFDPIVDGEGWTGSGGNSLLKPLESTQFDTSLEYYYSKGSGFGIALFKKDVDNFVVPLIIDTVRNLPEAQFTLPHAGNKVINTGGDNLAVRFQYRCQWHQCQLYWCGSVLAALF
ncbi:TonB-dependent receptor domain-containing protein [Alishewanella longhuensis]